MQNLIKITRDTLEELEGAVRKDIQRGDYRVSGITVLEQHKEGLMQAGGDQRFHWYEAWIVTDDLALAGFE